jgi:hypothetical protein
MVKKASSKGGTASASAGIEVVYRVGGQEFTDKAAAETHAAKHSVEAKVASAVSAVMQRTAARKRQDVHEGVKHVCTLLLTNPELAARLQELISGGGVDAKAATRAVAKTPKTKKPTAEAKAPRAKKPAAPESKPEKPAESENKPEKQTRTKKAAAVKPAATPPAAAEAPPKIDFSKFPPPPPPPPPGK